MPEKNCFVQNPAVSTRILDKGAAIYNADLYKERIINETGLLIWKLLDGSKNLRNIASAVLKHFDVSDETEVFTDVVNFLQELEIDKFVTQNDKSEPQNIDTTYINYNDTPFKLDVSLTGKCNLRCPFCYYADEMVKDTDLTTQTWVKFFNELKNLAVRELTISGGEVLLRQDFWELIDSIIENKMRFSILTNGTLIDDEWIENFNRFDRKRRLKYIQVSLDGSCADVHEKIRGKGTFAKTVAGLRKILQAELPVTARVTINQHNYLDLDNIASFLLDDVGISSFSTNETAMIGAGAKNHDSIVMTSKQKLIAMTTITKLAKKYNGRITSLAGPLTDSKMYAEMETAAKTGVKSKSWKMGFLSACGCVFNNLNINFDGSITPCVMLSDITLGQIQQDSIKDIWLKHPFIQKMRKRSEIPMKSLHNCKNCEWVEFCNGGCPGTAYAMTGEVNTPNQQFCYKKFLEEIADE